MFVIFLSVCVCVLCLCIVYIIMYVLVFYVGIAACVVQARGGIETVITRR